MKSYNDSKKISQKAEGLLKRIEQEIHSIVLGAEIILYGSRARGDASPLSDWDFLILVDQPIDRIVIKKIKNTLYELELETDTVLVALLGLKRSGTLPDILFCHSSEWLSRRGSHCERRLLEGTCPVKA